jgi:thioredoxin 1
MSTEHANLFYVGDTDFDAKVIKSNEPVIVDFWANWCGPCRAIAPVFERLSDEYRGKLRFAKMDIDQHSKTPGEWQIQAIPTLLIFKDGKPIGRLVGPHPTHLKSEIEKVLVANGIAIA